MNEIFDLEEKVEIPQFENAESSYSLEIIVNKFMHLHSGDELMDDNQRITPGVDPVKRMSNYQVSTGEVANFAYIVDSLYCNNHGEMLTDADYELCRHGVFSEDVVETLEESPHVHFVGALDDRDAEWISEGAFVGKEVGSVVDEIYDKMDDPTKEELREMAVDATHYSKCR